MKGDKLLVSVPEVYHGFLPAFFRETVLPPETAATCETCAMWADENTYPGGIVFSRQTKCCTHYPEIPNFLVGALFLFGDAAHSEGVNRMRALIAARVTARPHGIVRTAKWEMFLRHSPAFFGRSERMVCPLFDRQKGLCTIHPFWDAVCSSWYCKYTAGHAGREFWLAWRRYFVHLQRELVRYTLLSMGFNPAVIMNDQSEKHTLTPESIDDRPPDDGEYQRVWGEWAGREEEFYREACSLVRALSAEEFEKISGMTERVLRRNLGEKHAAVFSTVVPPLLRRNPDIKLVGRDHDDFVALAYSPFDPMQMSERLYRILDHFDGTRNTEDVLRDLRERGEAVPSEEILLMLYRFHLLIPPGVR